MKKLILIIIAISIQTLTCAQIPNFTMTDTKGDVYNLHNTLDSGKVVVIDFFSTTCGSCQLAMPEMESIWTEVLNTGELGYVWAIETSYKTDSAVMAFFDEYPGSFPAFSVVEDDSVINDSFGFHVPYTPYYYILAPNYKMYNVASNEVRSLVRDLLGISGINDKNDPNFAVRSENGRISFELPEQYGQVTVELYDLMGRKIIEEHVNASKNFIDVKSVNATNIVILKIRNGQSTVHTTKLRLQ
ncbi:MAG: redoxin domain-containing protein [Salinivirgaceae bacterium]